MEFLLGASRKENLVPMDLKKVVHPWKLTKEASSKGEDDLPTIIFSVVMFISGKVVIENHSTYFFM